MRDRVQRDQEAGRRAATALAHPATPILRLKPLVWARYPDSRYRTGYRPGEWYADPWRIQAVAWGELFIVSNSHTFFRAEADTFAAAAEIAEQKRYATVAQQIEGLIVSEPPAVERRTHHEA